MEEFLRYNGVSLILIVLGLLSVFVTYGAARASAKSGRYVSGIPFVGLILLLIGGLISAFKPLALLALIDPGPWWMIGSMIRDYKLNKVFFDYLESNGSSRNGEYDYDLKLLVRYDGNEIKLPYKIGSPYYMTIGICFAIMYDQDGNRYVILDRRENGLDKISFDWNTVEVVNPDYKKNNGNMTIEVVSAKYD